MKEILKMLQKGLITVEEAETLLDMNKPLNVKKGLRIIIKDENDNLDITIPLAMAKSFIEKNEIIKNNKIINLEEILLAIENGKQKEILNYEFKNEKIKIIIE